MRGAGRATGAGDGDVGTWCLGRVRPSAVSHTAHRGDGSTAPVRTCPSSGVTLTFLQMKRGCGEDPGIR